MSGSVYHVVTVGTDELAAWVARNRTFLDAHTFVAGSIAERVRDARWSCGLICTVEPESGQPVGALTYFHPRFGAIADRNIDALLQGLSMPGGGPVTGDRVVFVGGLHRLHGGAFVDPRLDAARRYAVLAALYRQSARVAKDLGRQALALFVPEDQADVAGRALDPVPGRVPAPPRAHLVGLDQYRDLQDYVEAQTKPVRHTLRRDHRRLATRDVEVEDPARLSTLVDASELIVQVKANNGIRDAARLTRMRLRAEYGELLEAKGPESYVAWCLRSSTGSLVGYSLAAVDGRDMCMIEIGLSDDSPTRGDDYVLLEVYAPLQYGLQRGIESIDLGGGHLDPKLSRGAVLAASYHLFM